MAQQEYDFSQGSIAKNIMSLAVPMTAAQLINVLYSVVDRIYLGRLPGRSHLALTGLGVTIPIVSIIMGFANLCGTGGGPIFSICRGQGDQEEAERVMGNSFSLLLILGAACTAFFLAFKRPILYLFGASDATFPYADDYMTIYLMGTLFVMISLGMNPFVNAQGFGSVGMMTVVLGAAVNIVLDPIFIFLLNMGVKGAALATGLGFSCTLLLFLIHFLSRRALLRLTLKGCGWREILRASLNGSAESINEISVGSIILLINHLMMARFGSSGVAAFTVVSYGSWFGLTLAYGLSDTLSPLVSANHAAGLRQRTHRFLHVALLSLLALGVVMFLVFSLYPQELARLFLPDNAAVGSLACDFIADFRWSFFFSGLNMGIACYLTGLNRSLQAAGMALSRRLVFPALFLSLFALWLEDEHIFWAIPLAEALTLLLGIGLLVHGRRRTGW